MALSISTCSSNLRLVLPYSKPSLPQPHLAAVPHPPKPPSIPPLFYSTRTPHPRFRRLRAQENPNEGSTEPEEESRSEVEVEEGSMTEVAAELKQMLKEKKERESQQQDESLLAGVLQEVREIEWPELGKVLATTGVVLAVIAGSTAALLSVNAVLAEISDRVFAGKGIQDFF